jgi:hypothetical protein
MDIAKKLVSAPMQCPQDGSNFVRLLGVPSLL